MCSKDLRILFVIFVGGAAGSSLRLFLSMIESPLNEFMPLTLNFLHTADIISCSLIGILYCLASNNLIHGPYLRPFLQTGFLGGLSSFSVLAVFLASSDTYCLSVLVIILELAFFIVICAITFAITQSLLTIARKKI